MKRNSFLRSCLPLILGPPVQRIMARERLTATPQGQFKPGPWPSQRTVLPKSLHFSTLLITVSLLKPVTSYPFFLRRLHNQRRTSTDSHHHINPFCNGCSCSAFLLLAINVLPLEASCSCCMQLKYTAVLSLFSFSYILHTSLDTIIPIF